MAAVMFSEEDVREILELFPPSRSNAGSLSPLLLSASGHGLVTLQQLQDEFLRRVTAEIQRISIANLATDLDVNQDVVLQLAKTEPTVVLFSGDGRMIVTKSERHSIQEELRTLMALGFVSKVQLLDNNDINTESLNSMLADFKDELIDNGDYVCSTDYKCKLSAALKDGLDRSLRETRPIDITPSDYIPKDTTNYSSISFKTPPLPFVYDILVQVLQSPDLADKFYILEKTESFCCTPKRLLEQEGDAVVSNLQSGVVPFVEISRFRKEFIYVTPEHVSQYFENSPDVEVIDPYAISRVWATGLGEECRRALDRDGFVNLQQRFAIFPYNTENHVLQQIEQFVLGLTGNPETELHRVAEYWLTEDGYASHKDKLLSHAAANAQLQWQETSNSPEKEIKFAMSNITTKIDSHESVLHALAQEKSTEKAIQEHFWNTVSEQQAQNEADFATFWNERVVSRTRIYNEGLGGVKDDKLLAQLAEVFASYAQKELVPDVISKAHSQGLVVSQKTRKNIQKLSSRLDAEKMDAATIMTALDKFNKKQSIESPGDSWLEESRKAMVLDMIRRMQKQKKSDGPVLFLTLVVLLFAKHHPGVVYATGKFAPKLLKQLKGVLEPDQYEQLEKWKEAAKTGTLSAEDREEMKKMAEV